LNPGTWFDYGADGKASVCIRICAGDDLKDLRKKTTTPKVEFKQGQRYSYDITNEDLYKDLLWDFCIVDWKGFVGKDGKAIPCTLENKSRLMGKSYEFSKFVGSCLDKLNELEISIREIREKN
jgi:hypothetical protein